MESQTEMKVIIFMFLLQKQELMSRILKKALKLEAQTQTISELFLISVLRIILLVMNAVVITILVHIMRF